MAIYILSSSSKSCLVAGQVIQRASMDSKEIAKHGIGIRDICLV